MQKLEADYKAKKAQVAEETQTWRDYQSETLLI